MKRNSDFFFNVNHYDYHLPAELIAKHPLQKRSASRLLVVARNSKEPQLKHDHFYHLVSYLKAGDLLIFNNTKVIPARLFGRKASGGKIECLIERILSEHTALAHIRASKSPKINSELIFSDELKAVVKDRVGDLYEVEFAKENTVLQWLERYGEIPLPPYMERAPESMDRTNYQTVYAEKEGAVAAPTAGLHFDEDLLRQLQDKGVEFAYVTLHVGAGTFQPVRVTDVREHVMHSEYMEIGETTCAKINACKARGGRVVAVGTTSVRCLETVAEKSLSSSRKRGSRMSDYLLDSRLFCSSKATQNKRGNDKLESNFQLIPYCGDTNIFIYPGFEFKVVDALITNFHLPKSTLIMLVCAFGGYDNILAAYHAAVQKGYRFYSYGDAMLIL